MRLFLALALMLAGCNPASPAALCVDGHPRHRAESVTYGGLPARHDFERDHIRPLCLGGQDTAANVQYQPWPEARIKDHREWIACEAYCAGRMSWGEAMDYVAAWRDE